MKIMTFSAALLAVTSLGTAVLAKEVRTTGSKDVETTGSLPRGAPSGTQWVGLAASPNGRVFQSNGFTESGARSAIKSQCEQTSGRTCRAIAVPDQWDVVVLQCSNTGRSDAFFGGSNDGNASWIAYEKARQNGFGDSQCKQIHKY